MTAQAPFATEHQSERSSTSGATYGSTLSADAFLSLGCMEGMFDSIVATPAAEEAAAAKRDLVWPGAALASGVALFAVGIHHLPFAPFTVAGAVGVGARHPISTAIIAILLGLTLRNTLALPDSIKGGCKRIVKKGIPIAIVCMGASLNLAHIASVGLTVLMITVLCVAFALAAGYYGGRLFGLGHKTSLLLGVGTGICGNSAIVAAAPLIDADDDDLVLSIGTVNLFGLLAMLAWPLIGGLLSLAAERFGVWAGVSIHAVPQVVAAGFAHSADAGTLATLVKLVRVALLAPLVFVLAILYARHHAADTNRSRQPIVHYARLVPWFVWGFVALALLNTFGLIPTLHFQPSAFLAEGTAAGPLSIADLLAKAGKILLTLAMAAIGLEVSVRQLAGVGGRAITAGLVSTAAVGAVSLLLILLLL